MQAAWSALIAQFAAPASLVTDDMLREKHWHSILRTVDRHFRALQPLWSIVLSPEHNPDRRLQQEARSIGKASVLHFTAYRCIFVMILKAVTSCICSRVAVRE